jgi:hypothetical protein
MAQRSPSTRFRAPLQRPGPRFPEALERLRKGGVLRLTYIESQPVWELDDRPVSPEVVSLITSCNEIAPDNDGLFDGAAPQSWRRQ